MLYILPFLRFSAFDIILCISSIIILISSYHLAVSPSRVAVGCMTPRFSALKKWFAELKMDLSIWPALLSAIDLDADHSLADDVEVPQLPPVHVGSARFQPKIPPLIQQIHRNSSTSSTSPHPKLLNLSAVTFTQLRCWRSLVPLRKDLIEYRSSLALRCTEPIAIKCHQTTWMFEAITPSPRPWRPSSLFQSPKLLLDLEIWREKSRTIASKSTHKSDFLSSYQASSVSFSKSFETRAFQLLHGQCGKDENRLKAPYLGRTIMVFLSRGLQRVQPKKYLQYPTVLEKETGIFKKKIVQ